MVLGLVSMLAASPSLGMGKAPEKDKAAIAACIEGDKLATVKARGYLKVGIRNGVIKGFIEHITATGEPTTYDGMEPDLARAIATAIFGTGNPDKKIEYVEVGLGTRFSALHIPEGEEGQTDVTVRTVTYTSKRDMTRDGRGFAFGPIYFYDGTNVLVDPNRPVVGTFNVVGADGASNLADLQRLKDGEIPGEQWPPNWDIVIVYSTTPESGDASKNTEQAFKNGTYTVPDWAPGAGTTSTINGFTSDTAILSAFKVANLPGSVGWQLHFDVPFTKSPLAFAVAEGDENWLEVVRWVFYVLIAAEEEGYGLMNGPRGLPPHDWGPTVPGLKKGWAKKVIQTVGNYKDIWDSNLGQYGDAFEPRGINNLYKNDGLHYPPPLIPDPGYQCQ
jgi:general L-amino acid transport system substrate-binding protein